MAGLLRAGWYEFCTIYQKKAKELDKENRGRKRVFCVGSNVMDEAQLEDKLKELVKEFGGTVDPQYGKLAMLAQQASESQNRLEKSVNNLQESLDYLRICIKYQLFDLEATRRENEYLRKILGENGNQGSA
jgi:UDP-N-acetylglucosamine 2-epimerase